MPTISPPPTIRAGSRTTYLETPELSRSCTTMGSVPDALPAPDANYTSGDDYVVEFLGYRFSFGATDFEGRVVAAAVKLGVVSSPELDEPASRLGRYLMRNWERVSLVGGESLVYWLRKLIFRGAWLDHQVKRGALEVVW